MNNFEFVCAKSVKEAVAAASLVADAMLAPPQASHAFPVSILKAGGIDVLDLLKEGLLSPASVTSLRDLPDLRGVVARADGGLHIGAMTTLAEVAAAPLVKQRYPALASAVGGSASPQIRNVATLGGNLLQRPRCWYFRSAADRCLRKGGGHCFAIKGENEYHAIFDNGVCAIVHPSTAATVLVALGAVVELINANGDVRAVLLEEFFVAPEKDVQRENDLAPQEILTAITIPPALGSRMVHLKLAQKDSFDWPLADVAAVLGIAADGVCQRASIVLGAAAPTPYRARGSEASLLGKTINEVLAREAGRAASAGAAPLSGNAYKLPIFETLVRRAILQTMNSA